ncbi:bifunctional diguanylate cyclase/phosphodiesterase [Chitinibacter tainanensis]|uniref:putative bifunctional diguanylate cyclase/phosphodiesterase n=1 Tax=Chitinibacter tainanensis TaxID=230667 RepID=UPI0023537715|nr:EAL domain-containing protein [Chitinibacter tainanensis]
MSQDYLQFAPEDPHQQPGSPPWQILVVDDEEDVHLSTQLVLKNLLLLGRPIALSHAYSGQQAFELLRQRNDFAVILLDVVMEDDFAGLDLVAKIRGILGLKEVRIILRTGQPGYAPEPGIFNLHDINDYRLKTELTSNRLITSISAALRSYEQICTLSNNRRGLEMIVHTEMQLMECREFGEFSRIILANASAIFGRECQGLVAQLPTAPGQTAFIGAISPALTAQAENILARRPIPSSNHHFDSREMWLHLQAGLDQAVIYLQFAAALTEFVHFAQLANVFAANTSACYGHLRQLERLNYLAYHDELTGLPNRHGLLAALEARSSLQGQSLAVLDLNRFADINDALGYSTGNALLCAVATRLNQHCAAESVLLARLANDVFALCGPQSLINQEALFALFKAPLQVAQHALPVQIALGLRNIEQESTTGAQLLEQAHMALNQAKHNPPPQCALFNPQMEAQTRWRHEVIQQLRAAFAADQLQLWFQPQLDLGSRQICGVEALLRWPGEQGFVHPPAVFIPLAEYAGLIIELGDWVLEQACKAYQQLAACGVGHVRIAVNISMVQFRSGLLLERIQQLLAQYQVPARALELEITESIAMDEPETVRQQLASLRALGLEVAIDDFGTGYSSLGQLRTLSFDRLKIDKSFVDDLASSGNSLYVEMIIALARRLNLATVAEGVETAAQAARLKALGCDIGQGYYFAKPMPLAALCDWVDSQGAAPAP